MLLKERMNSILCYITKRIDNEGIIYFISGLLIAFFANLSSSFVIDKDRLFNIYHISGGLLILISGFVLLMIAPIIKKIRKAIETAEDKGIIKRVVDVREIIKPYLRKYGKYLINYIIITFITFCLGIFLIVIGYYKIIYSGSNHYNDNEIYTIRINYAEPINNLANILKKFGEKSRYLNQI